MKRDNKGHPVTVESASDEKFGGSQRRLMTILASAGSALLATGGIVAALTMSAGAQLPFSPEAAASSVTATPGFGSNRDSGFDLRRPQFTAQAPATPGQVECIPNLSRSACPPSRNVADSAAAGWLRAAQGPYTAIQSSLQTAASEMQAQNMDGVRSACQQILSNSQRLRNTLPSPDEALTAEVEGAVSELITAANMCLGPDATSNAQALMSHVEQANAHFANAQQIMESKSP
ncbi:hypothetical protein ABGB19_24895 [Mycobacterium sp. B14F4]|uniref:hypothetical protein n=1 Tax=Mycobacterium sp. B14F4 TaxID=3153565 RepID=UPI00325DC7D3